ncbi:hypothetical protein ACQY0O_003963 [Thecaphora frezii]
MPGDDCSCIADVDELGGPEFAAGPQIVERPELSLYRCRHPLKELSDDSFVPNDIRLHGGRGIDPEELGNRLVGENQAPNDDSEDLQSVLIVTGA